MAFWTAPFRVDPTADREASMYAQGPDGLPSDASSDLFGQFMDFDGDGGAKDPLDDSRGGDSTTMGGAPDSFFAAQAAPGTASSAVSSIDEFDFFSNSSHMGPAASAASHGLDSQELAFGVAADPATSGAHQLNQLSLSLSRKSMSETELQRLEDISLHSPRKKKSSVSHPPSPTPPNTSTRKPKKLVEALSSTLRKATTLGRRSKKHQYQQQQQQQQPPHPLPDRAASPTLDHPPMAIKSRAARMPSTGQATVGSVSYTTPSPTSYDNSTPAFHPVFCDDPFAEPPRLYHSPSMQFYHGAIDPTTGHSSTRRIKSEQHLYQAASSMMPSPVAVDPASQAPQPGPWPQQMMMAEQWGGASADFAANQDPTWWDLDLNASMNQAMHSQHGELPYEYAPLPDANAAGLMIHMPQPRPVVTDIGLNAQTYLPPPPPPVPPTDRCNRPPRAPSSGARHRNLSSSPMRKTRGPSASPTPMPTQLQMRNQSRHSSTGSVSSVRSASGRGPGAAGSAPNTPGGVRKRRSRDAGAGGGGGGGGGGGSIGFAGDGIGFVNFTPSDGSILMTGVAPSGSSKTKARREKEAQEKRRRLSEAAMKAVAAAGGDVDKLIQEGFVF
ncbi:hypothetical protein M419DRAFT_9281 [Trichoderma reesei RUT C-30]|nr:hypothetical protein M419DRAFT_9281 [Trichoderma reesei RUT C-30]